MAFVVYLVPTLVSGLWIGSFWVLKFVSYGYILPFKFTSILHFWPALEDELLDSTGLGLLLPFGLSFGPRILSRVLKPVVAQFKAFGPGIPGFRSCSCEEVLDLIGLDLLPLLAWDVASIAI